MTQRHREDVTQRHRKDVTQRHRAPLSVYLLYAKSMRKEKGRNGITIPISTYFSLPEMLCSLPEMLLENVPND